MQLETILQRADLHWFQTETDIISFWNRNNYGDTTTQDPMFVRFSNQEDLNTTPTATNTAGTFRLDTGNEIRAALQGKDYVFVITDLAAYVIQFVGPPFTFSVRQVGTTVDVLVNMQQPLNGAVFWMDHKVDFVFDGTVKSLPCLVEDFVFSTDGDNLGLNFNAKDVIFAGANIYTQR